MATGRPGHMQPGTNNPGSAVPAGRPGPGGFPCQSQSFSHHCYGPAQIRAAYQIQPLLDQGTTGAGETIVIVDAFQNPTMGSDLQSFDNYFGLPAPPRFRTVAPFGLTPFDPNNSDQVAWSGEIALDVEWAHAVAPGANIVLALSPSNADADMVATEAWAIDSGAGDVISMSYGDLEACMSADVQARQHQLFAKATSRGITLVAATGDWGPSWFTCDGKSLVKGIGTPASDPYVTAVGGTQLTADLVTGQYKNEVSWDEADAGAGGGGYSTLYPAPDYQRQLPGAQGARAIPDVAYDAAFDGGVLVAWGSSGFPPDPVWNIYWIFFGTSSGAPQWSGLTVLADQLRGSRIGQLNPALYSIGSAYPNYAADFHDITKGNNNWAGISGYGASAGWDPVTGLGSPIANGLIPDLARFATSP